MFRGTCGRSQWQRGLFKHIVSEKFHFLIPRLAAPSDLPQRMDVIEGKRNDLQR